MSKIQDMLRINGNSFLRAEQWAHGLIDQGHADVWLDLALLLHAQGKLTEARSAQAEYAKVFPDCPRVKFGQSWFKLYDGDLQGGLEHIEVGRKIGVLGDQGDVYPKPQWDGVQSLSGKTCLLHSEGGCGDQIMGLRAAKWLADSGAKVIVACTKSLVNLFSKAPGVSAVVSFESSQNLFYDYWVPGMSGFRLCKADWNTLWPADGAYLPIPEDRDKLWSRIIPPSSKLNVGLRWKGNPEFEHEQFRWFPETLLFDSISNSECNFYSLQRDDPKTIIPDGIVNLETHLSTWEETAKAISRLDLVITSCTSIAHLSAAMGKPTWVVVPAMPYYPWARPGNKSDWYPTVTLFRQRCFGDWKEPFDEIKNALQKGL